MASAIDRRFLVHPAVEGRVFPLGVRAEHPHESLDGLFSNHMQVATDSELTDDVSNPLVLDPECPNFVGVSELDEGKQRFLLEVEVA